MNEKLNSFKNKINGKNVGVIGIGISNTPLIKMLINYGANVVARDKKSKDELGEIAGELEKLNVTLILGENYLQNINEDILFKTPGIRYDKPEILEAQSKGCEITSEMEMFFELCPAKIIAVTGSDGKTTTTTLIYEMLTKSGYNCYLGGNIGTPLLDKIEEMSEKDIAVLELSSFQLQTMKKSPSIAVITNISPNHLDYHKSMAEYINAKENIYKYQKISDRLILNFDNEITKNLGEKTENAIYFSRKNNNAKSFIIKDDYISFENDKILNINDIKLPGMHNIENYMAAIAAVWGLVDKNTIIELAKNFGGVKHRIEFVKEIDGVKYYNDSIASSPTRAKAGLYSFDKKLILIAGGYDKNIPFDDFGYDIINRVKILVLMGKTAPKIKQAVLNASTYKGEPKIVEASDLKQAVQLAKENAVSGDVVILSPACASFDMFKNFEVRGNQFIDIVMNL